VPLIDYTSRSRWGEKVKRLGLLVIVLTVMFLVGFSAARIENDQSLVVRRAQIAMGTLVEIEVRGLAEQQANLAINAAYTEIRRVEALLAGVTHIEKGILIPQPEVDRVLQACAHSWQVSEGAFDCNLGSLINAWGFSTGKPVVPSAMTLDIALRTSGWDGFNRNSDGSWTLVEDAWLNFGAIGKGYAVDRAMETLVQHGVQEGLVNAGGDLRTLGSDWVVGIQHPRQPSRLVGQITVGDKAVATSGDYEQVLTLDGEHYHHILDPYTGMPARGMQSVTVIAPTSMEADILSTAVFVLGREAGLSLVERLPEIEAYLIDESGMEFTSTGFYAYWQGE
jgi:FAD:protein FMN transferase